MSRKPNLPLWQRTLIGCALEIAVLLVLHFVLLRYMATHDVASVIFSAGTHVKVGILLLAGCFICVRLLVALALPGMILARIGLVFLDWRSR